VYILRESLHYFPVCLDGSEQNLRTGNLGKIPVVFSYSEKHIDDHNTAFKVLSRAVNRSETHIRR
jgi:hypothetical protein